MLGWILSSGCKATCLCGHRRVSVLDSFLDIKVEHVSTQPICFRGGRCDIGDKWGYWKPGSMITGAVPLKTLIVVGERRKFGWCSKWLKWASWLYICACMMRLWIFSTWKSRRWHNTWELWSDSTKSVSRSFPSMNFCQRFWRVKDRNLYQNFESTLSSLWNLNLHFTKHISQMYLRLTQGMTDLLLKKLMNRSKTEFLLQSFCTSIRAVIQWHTLEKSIILQANQELTQLSLFASHRRHHLTKNLVLFS